MTTSQLARSGRAAVLAGAIFFGPLVVAVALAFTQHPELLDVLVVVLLYVAASYWAIMVPWYVIRVRRFAPRLRPMGKGTRFALIVAAPVVAYLGFWWGGLGIGLAFVTLAVHR